MRVQCPATDEEALKKICELVKEDRIDEAIEYCRWAINWCGRGLHAVDWDLYFLKHNLGVSKEYFLSKWCKELEQKPSKPTTPPKVYVTVEFKPDKPIKMTDKGATIYAYEDEYIPFRIKVIDITPRNCDVKLALYDWQGSPVWTAWASELLGKEIIVKRSVYHEGYFSLGVDYSAGYKGCWLGGVKVTPYSRYYVAIIGKKPTVKILKFDVEPTEVYVGEEVKATAVLHGTPKSSWKVELYVDGNKVADKYVTLSAYGDAYVTFTLKFKDAGKYNICICCTDSQSVGGLSYEED